MTKTVNSWSVCPITLEYVRHIMDTQLTSVMGINGHSSFFSILPQQRIYQELLIRMNGERWGKEIQGLDSSEGGSAGWESKTERKGREETSSATKVSYC